MLPQAGTLGGLLNAATSQHALAWLGGTKEIGLHSKKHAWLAHPMAA